MSAGQRGVQRRQVSVDSLAALKADGEPIVMVTAYDYPSAQIAEEAGVDLVLVGDSAGNVVLGHDSTVQVSVEPGVTARGNRMTALPPLPPPPAPPVA